MANLEEELRLDQEDDAREAEYIMQQLPADLKEQYSTEDIHYLMDLIVEYYYESGLLESSDDEIDIDLQQVAEGVCKMANDEGHQQYKAADVFFVVQADLDYQEENL
jgi:hypothetical protein